MEGAPHSQGGSAPSPISEGDELTGGELLAAAAIVDVHGPAESARRIADKLTVEARRRFRQEET